MDQERQNKLIRAYVLDQFRRKGIVINSSLWRDSGTFANNFNGADPDLKTSANEVFELLVILSGEAFADFLRRSEQPKSQSEQ